MSSQLKLISFWQVREKPEFSSIPRTSNFFSIRSKSTLEPEQRGITTSKKKTGSPWVVRRAPAPMRIPSRPQSLRYASPCLDFSASLTRRSVSILVADLNFSFSSTLAAGAQRLPNLWNTRTPTTTVTTPAAATTRRSIITAGLDRGAPLRKREVRASVT